MAAQTRRRFQLRLCQGDRPDRADHQSRGHSTCAASGLPAPDGTLPRPGDPAGMNGGRSLIIPGLAAGCALAVTLMPAVGNPLLVGVVLLLILGACLPGRRKQVWTLACAVLGGCCLAMLALLASDSFEVRYVWLYSSEALPLYLKLANLWGGDEGTLLLLGLLIIPAALRHADGRGLEGSASGLIVAWYVGSALWLGPFTATPVDWLAAQPSQGMNAHLQSIWMAL